MKNILLLTAALLIGTATAAKAEILNFNYTPEIQFNAEKPSWYQSDYKTFLEVRLPKLEIPLTPTDGTDGDWSMRVINTDTSKNTQTDLTGKLFYLGMLYKFK